MHCCYVSQSIDQQTMKPKQILIYLFLVTGIVALQNCTNENSVIRKNTYAIDSISPSDENYADLSFLKDILKDKKIVLLGEAGHGDGTTFEAKTRLIKYLHEDLHYNVLAFEGATPFDLLYASAAIKKGRTPQVAEQQLKYGLFWVWSGSKEFRPMADYIGQNIDSLSIEGIDDNFALTYYDRFFPKLLDWTYHFSENHPEIDYQNFLTQCNRLSTENFRLTNDSTFHFDAFIQDVGVVKKIVNESDEGSLKLRAYFNLELDNLSAFAMGVKMGLSKLVPFREKRMAENLAWMIDNYYPNEKVIVWTANVHASKHLNEAIYKEGDDRYQQLTPLGQLLADQYGEDNVYSIACTSTEGSTNGEQGPEKISIPPTSWDYQFAHNIKDDYAFVDFSQIRKSKYGDKEFESTIMGYKPHMGKWYHIFDGILFIRKMKPSTFK